MSHQINLHDATGIVTSVPGLGITSAVGTTVPASASTGYAPGCIFQDLDASAGAMLWVNEGTKASASFVSVPTGGTTGAADVGILDSGAFTSAANVEAALAELYQHLFSAQAFIPLPLNTFRETSSMDVADIAANGGILASDTTPVLDAINAATDGCQRLLWASSNNDQIATSVVLPPDIDVASDLIFHCRIVSAGTTNAVGFTLASYFNEGDTAVADSTTTNQTATWAEKTATIAAADIPAGAQTLSIGLTPVAHTTDTMAMSAAWLEYTKVLLTA